METKDILLLVAGAVIGLFVNYFSQFTSTPLLKKYSELGNRLAQRKATQSVKKAKNRIKSLEEELVTINEFYESPVSFMGYASIQIIVVITILIFLVFIMSLFLTILPIIKTTIPRFITLGITLILSGGVFVVFMSNLQSTFNTLLRVWTFKSYEEYAQQEIQALNKFIEESTTT